MTEGAQGIINLKTTTGMKPTTEKTITLGEEHTEMLPNGVETKVKSSKHLKTKVIFHHHVDPSRYHEDQKFLTLPAKF